MHLCMRVVVCMHAYVCSCPCLTASMYTCMRVCMYNCTHVCIYISDNADILGSNLLSTYDLRHYARTCMAGHRIPRSSTSVWSWWAGQQSTDKQTTLHGAHSRVSAPPSQDWNHYFMFEWRWIRIHIGLLSASSYTRISVQLYGRVWVYIYISAVQRGKESKQAYSSACSKWTCLFLF